MSNPAPTPNANPQLRLRLANEAELPFIHLLTVNEPYFFHVDGKLIGFREFTDMDIKWYVLTNDDPNQYYGIASLGHIDLVNRSAAIGLVVLPDKRRGTLGKQALQLITKLGFETFGLHKLWASVVEDNRVVWEGMRRYGWTVSGRLMDAQFMEGKFHNRVLLELINGRDRKESIPQTKP